MSGIALLPELASRLRRYRVELLWVAFAVTNYAVMIAWPAWETIPFHFVWISLTLLYGFRVWPVRRDAHHLGVRDDGDGGLDRVRCVPRHPAVGGAVRGPADGGDVPGDGLACPAPRRRPAHRRAACRGEPLAARPSGAVHPRRIPRAARRRSRSPAVTSSCCARQTGQTPELEVALDELARIDAITGRLLLLATVDQPDFVRPVETELEPLLEEVFMRWSEVAPRSWRLGPLAVRLAARRPRAAARCPRRPDRERRQVHAREPAAIELRARANGRGGISIEVRDEGCGVPASGAGAGSSSGSPAPTRPAPGRPEASGSGSAIADAIVKAHGGSCGVVSTPQGSVFALRLPHFTPARRRCAGAPWTAVNVVRQRPMPPPDAYPSELSERILTFFCDWTITLRATSVLIHRKRSPL